MRSGLTDLQGILTHYSSNFCNKTCVIQTSYVPLSEIQIVFNETDLHHLLGLHKVTNNRAKKNIEYIKNKTLTIDKIKKHSAFSDIRYRIEGFYALDQMLISPGAEVCILAKDLKRNSMDLDVLLMNPYESDSVMVLGLRRSKDKQLFYLTTLHKTSSKKYKNHRMTKIKNISWI